MLTDIRFSSVGFVQCVRGFVCRDLQCGFYDTPVFSGFGGCSVAPDLIRAVNVILRLH